MKKETSPPTRADFWPQIDAAFEGITLGEGIGYFEGGAIDDWLTPDDPLYQQAKARDIRHDWRVMRDYFLHESFKPEWVAGSRSCFMDLQGLRYYLPVFLGNPIFDGLLDQMILCSVKVDVEKQKPPSKQTACLAELTEAQKQCLLAVYARRYQSVLEKAQIPFVCSSCGATHIPWVKWDGVSPESYVQDFDETEAYFFLRKYLSSAG